MPSLIILLTFLVFALPSFADEVGLLVSREKSHTKRMELIRNAKSEILLSTFIFELDDFGKETLGLLADAAQRGVVVKLNIDGMMNGLPKNYSILKALRSAGVEIKLYNPIYRNIVSANYRNHMKALIVDGKSMVLGDRNMTSSYFRRKSDRNYIGLDAIVSGEQVKEARNHFNKVYEIPSHMKHHAGIVLSDESLIEAKKNLKEWEKTATENLAEKVTVDSHQTKVTSAKYVADVPAGKFSKDVKGVHKEILTMINRATTTLEFVNPYVLITPETKLALQAALDRGVKIRINTNSSLSTDSHAMAMAWDVKKNELLEMGIEVNELKKGNFLHAKSIIRDGKEIFIGSFNLDPRSQNLNLENGILVTDESLAKRLGSYHRRIQESFMTRVVAEVPDKMTMAQKTGHCVKQGLRKFVTNAMLPFL